MCQLVRIAASRLYYFRQFHPSDFLIDAELLKDSPHICLECIHRDRVLGTSLILLIMRLQTHHHPQLVAKMTLRCQIEWFSLLVKNHQQSGPATYLLQRRESTPFSSCPIGNHNC
ncbi:hypothetical protein M9H77_03078 [Catharanthus roseus]|uniref:Uncharacterized protein n=1 Tax=Catharanthus roseus TaxID=4058 RepID=A0ACC0CAE6_CATRO|nr:hypothetical protein M9H77_03078 [Catharanthus roseus]